LAVSCKVVFEVSNQPLSQDCTLEKDTDNQWQRWKYTTPVWIALVRPIFWPFPNFVWVSTHTLWTTGSDQRTNRCVKLQRQVFLNFSAEPWW